MACREASGRQWLALLEVHAMGAQRGVSRPRHPGHRLPGFHRRHDPPGGHILCALLLGEGSLLLHDLPPAMLDYRSRGHPKVP